MTAKESELNVNEEKKPEPGQEEEIFRIEEIKVEELAIDGICGVY